MDREITGEEFESLCERANPIQIFDLRYARFGFKIKFDDGSIVELEPVEPDNDYGSSHITFTLIDKP